jgi:hypothetical protein
MDSTVISEAQQQFFDENGYLVIKQLFEPDEVIFYRDHYMCLRTAGTYPGLGMLDSLTCQMSAFEIFR